MVNISNSENNQTDGTDANINYNSEINNQIGGTEHDTNINYNLESLNQTGGDMEDDTNSIESDIDHEIPNAGNRIVCDICNEIFKGEVNQKQHMKKHGGKYKCFKCQRGYETKDQRHEHMQKNICSKK